MSSFTKLYRQTVGNLYLRGVIVGALYKDLERALEKGWKTKGVKMQLTSLGEGDYIPGQDDGEPPKGAKW